MVLSIDRWIGKVAVVTGASSGIGAAIAKNLVIKGLKVVGIARRVEKVKELSKQLCCKKGKLYALKADIGNEDELLAALEWVKTKFGVFHILVNNAGVMKMTSLTDGNTDDWRAIFDVNVLGLTIATREAVRVMTANGIDGHIIHINSMGGHYVPNFPGMGPYPSSKHAVTALTETLRQELNRLGSKIKVTSISPGGVASEMTTGGGGDRADQVKEGGYPLLNPEDIAEGVVYVLSTPPHVQVHELMIRPVGEPI